MAVVSGVAASGGLAGGSSGLRAVVSDVDFTSGVSTCVKGFLGAGGFAAVVIGGGVTGGSVVAATAILLSGYTAHSRAVALRGIVKSL